MSITLDPPTTALVLIDMQKGILGRQLAPYDTDQLIENASALGRGLKNAVERWF